MTSNILTKDSLLKEKKIPLSLKLLPIVGLLIGIMYARYKQKCSCSYISFGLLGAVTFALPAIAYYYRKPRNLPIAKAKPIEVKPPLTNLSQNIEEEEITSSFLEYGKL